MNLLKAQRIVLSEMSNTYNVKVYKEIRKGISKLFKELQKENLKLDNETRNK